MDLQLVGMTDTYLHYKCCGDYSLKEGEQLLQKIYNTCLKYKVKSVLVDITEKNGHIPDVHRFLLGKFIAQLYSYKIKIAVIGRRDEINKFSEDVAINRGGRLLVTADKDEAVVWLRN